MILKILLIIVSSALLLVLFFVLILRFGDKWENRYKKQAKHYCKCMDPWESKMSPNLIRYYALAADVNIDKDRDMEQKQYAIGVMKDQLSNEDRQLNKRWGKEFLNKNSNFNKCWDKKLPWDGEYPGNNTKYTVHTHARKRGCNMVYTLLNVEYSQELWGVLFDNELTYQGYQ